jgi:hypothetical protein
MRGLRHLGGWRPGALVRAAAGRVRGTGRVRDDRGAVAATVAIVLGTGVLIGMATVVVDVGRLYAEREQLQSGADAAAWAVAEGCVLDPTACADQAGTAQSYADGNAADGAAAVTVICGSGPDLPGCPPPADNRTDCLGEAPDGIFSAEVRTATRLPDDSTLLPPAFAGVIAGGEYEGTEVGACARVAWGPPRVATGFAVTFSVCEWEQLTSNGTVYWPVPAAGTPPDEAERVVYLKGSGDESTCPAGPSGWDAPGGFGWLDDPEGADDGEPCQVTIEVDGSFGGNTGNSVSRPCRTALTDALAGRRPSLIPIYDAVRGQGANTTYHLAGFASFVLTGYHMSGFQAPSWLTGRHLCSGNERCLYGYFTRGLVPSTGQEIGGPDLGVSIINLVG